MPQLDLFAPDASQTVGDWIPPCAGPIDPDSPYAPETNPEALHRAVAWYLAGLRMAWCIDIDLLHAADQPIAHPKRHPGWRQARQHWIRSLEHLVGGVLSEYASAFGTPAADHLWDIVTASLQPSAPCPAPRERVEADCRVDRAVVARRPEQQTIVVVPDEDVQASRPRPSLH